MRTLQSGILYFLLAITATACSQSDNPNPFENGVVGIDSENWRTSTYTCPSHSLSWNDVNDWYYQLQYMDYFDLSRTQYDLLVIDPDPAIPLNRNVLDRIRCDGNGEKLVLAYLPIGKAENFRSCRLDVPLLKEI